jgi:hypothetical protein
MRPGRTFEERRGRAPVGRILLLNLLVGGCQLVGSPRALPDPAPREVPGSPHLQGTYRGVLAIDGGEVPAILELRQPGGRRLEGILGLSSDFEAMGQGESGEGGRMELELRYDGACPGHMTLQGTLEPGEVLTGVVTASDCTGRAEGTFRFSR